MSSNLSFHPLQTDLVSTNPRSPRWLSALRLFVVFGLVASHVAHGQDVTLSQVDPNVHPRAGFWRIVLEPVADPDDRRDGLVNFAFEMENVSGEALFLNGMTFEYRNAQGSLILEQSVDADDIRTFLHRYEVWQSNWAFSGSNPALVDLPWDTFDAGWQHLKEIGFQIVDIEIREKDGQFVFSGIFQKGNQPIASIISQPWPVFLSQWQTLESLNYRMMDIETYYDLDGQTRLYSGLLKSDTYDSLALVGQAWADFSNQWSEAESNGMRMFDLEVLANGDGDRLYTGLMRPGNFGPKALIGNTWDEFLSSWQNIKDEGYRMIDLETYFIEGELRYSGLFEPGGQGVGAVVNLPWEPFLEDWHLMDGGGYRMFDLELRGSSFSGLFEPDDPLSILPPGQPIRWESEMRILFMAPQGSFMSPRWPTKVEVTLSFDNAEDASFELPIEVYSNKNPQGSFAFPANQEDLPVGQYWSLGAHAGHEGPRPSIGKGHNNHRGALSIEGKNFCFGQQYAYDFGVSRWNGSQWGKHSGGDQNSDYYIWDTPIYAVEDGDIIYCHASAADNSAPGMKDALVDGVPGGGNLYFIRHTGGEVALYAHLKAGSALLCPADGIQDPPISVSQGELLGRVGNSGNSSNPHLHFHVQETWDEASNQAAGLPVLFDQLAVGRPVTPNGADWEDVQNQGLASGNQSILIDLDP